MPTDLDVTLRKAGNAQLGLASTASDGYQDLGLSVVRLAVKDAKRGKVESLAWLRAKGEMFRFWAEVLGLDADALAEKAIEVIADKRRLPRESLKS